MFPKFSYGRVPRSPCVCSSKRRQNAPSDRTIRIIICFAGIVGCLTAMTFNCCAANIPVTGHSSRLYAPVDEAILRFMKAHEIHAATLAISKDGVIQHERAFGYADQQLTRPLSTTVCMRMASCTKPVTAAAIRALARQGKLKLTDPVMKHLRPDRFPAPVDKRWEAITLQQLLDHSGGWDSNAAGDPMFQYKRIQHDLKLEVLAPRDAVRWMMTQPLQFDPGAKSVYSNFGFCLLGVVIEEVTGRKYVDYVKNYIGKVAVMTSLGLSSSDPKHRSKCETWYDFGGEGDHFQIELMDGNAGLVCTAGDLTRFLNKFLINGEPRIGRTVASSTFFGSMPGTTAVVVQRPDGINCALLLNRRNPKEKWDEQLRQLLDTLLPHSDLPDPKSRTIH